MWGREERGVRHCGAQLARIRPTVALLVVPLLSIRSMMVEFMERLTLESLVLDELE